jgi:hypothetical protein
MLRKVVSRTAINKQLLCNKLMALTSESTIHPLCFTKVQNLSKDSDLVQHGNKAWTRFQDRASVVFDHPDSGRDVARIAGCTPRHLGLSTQLRPLYIRKKTLRTPTNHSMTSFRFAGDNVAAIAPQYGSIHGQTYALYMPFHIRL